MTTPRRAAVSGADRAQATRAVLVGSAIATLAQVGFGRATAREIAGRAGCNQALIFYHFGSVPGLLLAALDQVSDQRLADYGELIEGAQTLTQLVDAAREVFTQDLAAGHVSVLVEMVAGAHSTPGLGEQVLQRLVPWRRLAEDAVRKALARSPLAMMLPAEELAHAVVGSLLGMEMLASLDDDRSAVAGLLDRARLLAQLLDLAPQPATLDDERFR